MIVGQEVLAAPYKRGHQWHGALGGGDLTPSRRSSQ